MNLADAIRQMLWERRMTQQNLADRCNVTQSIISGRLSRKNGVLMRHVLTMVNACGYELTIQPIKAGRRQENQIVITAEDEEE